MRRSAMRRLASIAFLACIGFGVPLPAQELPPQDMPAQNLAVDLELILAVDVSDSIDEREARLQREGYIAAMADPEIVEAVVSGPPRRIAMTYVEWAQSGQSGSAACRERVWQYV